MHSFDDEHRKGNLKCVSDASSRMFQDDEEEQPIVGAFSWATTKVEWYLGWQKMVLEQPNSNPR